MRRTLLGWSCALAGVLLGACGGSSPTALVTSWGDGDGGVRSAANVTASAAEGGLAQTPSGDASPTEIIPSGGGDTATSQVPTIGGCPIFPADSPWNTRIDDPGKFPVHPQSATYLAKMSPSSHLHPDWGDWSTDHYGIPWQTVPADQAPLPMTFSYASESDPGPYPFPTNALVEGGAGSGGDMHVLVIDSAACTLYETWNSSYVAPGWTCGSGAKFDLRSNALRVDGWTSADAAGLPILPGLVKVSEVKAGVIAHALRFTMNSTQQAYIHPATHAAGKSDPTLPPMGLRLRLKATVATASFVGPAKVVITALQQYGLILADNGSDWYVSGDSDDAWTPWMDGMVQALDQLHGSDFEAVETGPLSTAGL
ncbi:MAG: hypothetical protein WBY94_06590 [Polyangiaceae bacterium]